MLIIVTFFLQVFRTMSEEVVQFEMEVHETLT